MRSAEDLARKKQLGQYFSGRKVGRLLAALAGAEDATNIIDPMVGSADLLAACLEVGATPSQLVGIELDPLALERAQATLKGVRGVDLVLSDAFSARLPTTQFDLVITNPPYIRYQSRGDIDGLAVPSAASVRSGLLRAIQERADLTEEDRIALVRAARTYPSTADIAVPAWVLCAALVREGGTLAIVAPQAWLSRNYARAVRELLDELFEIQVIVEDGDASWFEDAQVRTQLVVAKKLTRATGGTGKGVVVARALRALDTKDALVGDFQDERAVVIALRQTTSPKSVPVTTGLTAHIEREFLASASGHTGSVPARVASVLGVPVTSMATRTLDSYGWRCGQGLRTGANDFFYVTVEDGQIRPAARWGVPLVDLPEQTLLPAIRRQADLTDQLKITAAQDLKARVVNLRGWVTPRDVNRLSDLVGEVKVLPPMASNWINTVATSALSPPRMERTISTLTAVAPNSREDGAGRSLGFWYQLPGLASRHRPILFMPRVCGGRPLAYTNEVVAVVDANFSSLWPTDTSALPVPVVSALLNSTWAWANLEATSTVLGGGALKVEATDLRRLALPVLAPEEVASLLDLGSRLQSSRDTQLLADIDRVIMGVFFGKERSEDAATALREYAQRAAGQRSRS